MQKLRLDFDALAVQIFATAAATAARAGMSYEYEEGCGVRALDSGFEFCRRGTVEAHASARNPEYCAL